MKNRRGLTLGGSEGMASRRGNAGAELSAVVLCIALLSYLVFSAITDILPPPPPSFDDGIKQEQQKAIDANVGGWQIDMETGERNFVYGVTKKE